MKRFAAIAAVLSLCLVSVLSSKGMAFTPKLTGEVEIQAIMDDELTPAFRVWSKSEWALVGTTSDTDIKLNLGLSSSKSEGWSDLSQIGNIVRETGGSMDYGFTYAQLEMNGEYWEGGPVLTTKVGDVLNMGSGYSQFIAYGYENGLTIEGAELGPVAVNYAYLLADHTRDWADYVKKGDPAQIITATTAIGNHDLSLSTAQHHAAFDVAIETTLRPMLGTTIQGAYIRDGVRADGVRQPDAYWATAKTTVVDFINVSATVQNVEDGYAPAFGTYSDTDEHEGYRGFPINYGEEGDKTLYVLPDKNADGFELAADAELWLFGPTAKVTYSSLAYADGAKPKTEISGEFVTEWSDYDVTLSAKRLTDRDSGSPVNTVTNQAKIDRSFGIVDAAYTLTHERTDGEAPETTHEIEVSASKTIDVFVFKGVDLSAAINLDSSRDADDRVRLTADAEYTTPMGITLGVHYGNYARDTGYGDPASIADRYEYVEGVYFTASTSMSF